MEHRNRRHRPRIGAGIVAATAVVVPRPHPGRAGLVRCGHDRRQRQSRRSGACRARAGHSPTRPCSTRGWTTTNWSDAEEALAIARELDDPALLARALTACGSAAVYDSRGGADDTSTRRSAWPARWATSGGCPRFSASRRRPRSSPATTSALRAAAEEGRDLADAIGDRFGSRQCGWRLAGAHIFEGDLTEAIAELRGVVADAEADHDVISRVTALLMLPHALAYQGDASAARAAAEAAIESAAELGDVFMGAILHLR